MVFNKVISIAAMALAAAGLAIVGTDIHEHRQLAKKVDRSVDELGKATEKDIQEGMVRRAVESASDRKVTEYLNRVKSEVFADARVKLSEEVRKAVRDAGDEMKKTVGDRIASEVSLIDMTDLKKSARDKAEAKILEKFDGNLEDLLAKFNDNLSNIQKIYGGIADAINKGQERDKGLKFTIG